MNHNNKTKISKKNVPQFVKKFVKRIAKSEILMNKPTREHTHPVLSIENLTAVAKSAHDQP